MSAKRKNDKAKTSSAKYPKIAPEDLLRTLKTLAPSLLDDSLKSFSMSRLSQAGIRQVLLFTGDQHLRMKRLIQWMKENLFHNDPSAVFSYFGTDLGSRVNIDNLLSSLGNLSLFSRSQLITIYEADKIKSAAAKALNEAVERGLGDTLLVLTAESIDAKGSFSASVSHLATIIEFAELDGTALRQWIQKEAVRAGAAGVETDALALLIQCYGGSLADLSPEIAKLALLTEEGGKISKHLVENLSLTHPERTSFELIGRLAQRDAEGSLLLTKQLLEQGFHPLQLLSFLTRCFRTLLARKDPAPQFTHAELENAWFVRNIAKGLHGFSELELGAALRLLRELDLRLKSSGLEPQLELARAVQRIALRGPVPQGIGS